MNTAEELTHACLACTDAANPGYLRVAMGNYLGILRRRGLAGVARAVCSTVTTQILGKSP